MLYFLKGSPLRIVNFQKSNGTSWDAPREQTDRARDTRILYFHFFTLLKKGTSFFDIVNFHNRTIKDSLVRLIRKKIDSLKNLGGFKNSIKSIAFPGQLIGKNNSIMKTKFFLWKKIIIFFSFSGNFLSQFFLVRYTRIFESSRRNGLRRCIALLLTSDRVTYTSPYVRCSMKQIFVAVHARPHAEFALGLVHLGLLSRL